MVTTKHSFEKRGGWLLSWWVKISEEKIGEDLVINTTQEFDHIYLNGKPLTNKQNHE